MANQTITIADLAQMLNAEFSGDGSCVITGIAPLDAAQPGHASFLDNAKYRKFLAETKASVVILSPSNLSICPTNAIISDNPHLSYAKMANYFAEHKNVQAGIHASVYIGQDCQIDDTVSIGPYTVIGDRVKIGKNVIIGSGCSIGDDSNIGDNCRLEARVTFYHKVHIGDRAIIHSGVVIGGDGFGFAESPQGWHKVPQLGSVIIGNDVEIGSNTTIDRGALKDTIIEDGVKLDNLIQIGHNVKIGAHTIIAACTAVAGSVTIGKYCVIGGCVAISGHITLTDRVMLAGKTAVAKSITTPGIYSSGIRAVPHDEWRKNFIYIEHLAEMAARLKKVEKLLELDKTT